LNQLKEILWQRLEKKGIYPGLIPCLIKSIVSTIPCISHANFEEVNRRLHLLGWDDFEMDYHTLQLVIASLENDGSIDSERNKSNQLGYRQPKQCLTKAPLFLVKNSKSEARNKISKRLDSREN